MGPIWPPPGTSQHPPGLLTAGEEGCCRSGQAWKRHLASLPTFSSLFTPSNSTQHPPFPPDRRPLPAQLIPAQRGDLRTRRRERAAAFPQGNTTSYRMTNSLGTAIWNNNFHPTRLLRFKAGLRSTAWRSVPDWTDKVQLLLPAAQLLLPLTQLPHSWRWKPVLPVVRVM